jgi:hypothetical protein
MTVRRMLRPPRPDAEWAERERLYLTIVQRADQTGGVQRARERVAAALDALLAADAEDNPVALIRFVRLVRAVVRAYVTAEPALREAAFPAGRVAHPEAGLLPPQLTYFLAPLASIGIVGQMTLRRLLEDRIARDGSALAKLVRHELGRQASFTNAVLREPLPLAELRRRADAARQRGRPAGRGDSTAGWTTVPGDMKSLTASIRPVVAAMKHSGDRVTIEAVAARLGIDERRLREAFAHDGINGPALLRALRSDQEEPPKPA